MHLSLIHNIPLDLRKHIDEHYLKTIQFYPDKRLAMWPSLRVLIESYQCPIIAQSSLQYLMYHQCVISRCLFGYSLSQINPNHGFVISNSLAESYLETGLDLVQKFEQKVDLSWLTQSRVELWKDICRVFLCHAYRTYKPSDSSIVYAEKFAEFRQSRVVA